MTTISPVIIYTYILYPLFRQKQNLDSYVTEHLFGGQGSDAIRNIVTCVRQVCVILETHTLTYINTHTYIYLFGGQGSDAIRNIVTCVRQVGVILETHTHTHIHTPVWRPGL